MNSNQIALSSMSMDLKRAALGYYRGSAVMAQRFFEEALKRKAEINQSLVEPYIKKLLANIETLRNEKDVEKIAEDALMYSILLQNASLKSP